MPADSSGGGSEAGGGESEEGHLMVDDTGEGADVEGASDGLLAARREEALRAEEELVKGVSSLFLVLSMLFSMFMTDLL